MSFKFFLFYSIFFSTTILFCQNESTPCLDSLEIIEDKDIDIHAKIIFDKSCFYKLSTSSDCVLNRVHFIGIIDSSGRILFPEFRFSQSSFSCKEEIIDYEYLKSFFYSQLICLLDNIIECQPAIKDNKPVTSRVIVPILFNWK